MVKLFYLQLGLQIESIFVLMKGGVEEGIKFHQHMFRDMQQGTSHSYKR